MSEPIGRSVFEKAMRRAFVAFCARHGLTTGVHDADAESLYQEYCRLLDEALELAGVALEPRPSNTEGKHGSH